jgi:hypothetical protein
MPTGNLRSGSNSAERYCERWSVKRLANVANRVRPAIVLVQQAAAAREVQQRQADKRRANAPICYCAARRRSSEDEPLRIHKATLQLSTLDGRESKLVAISNLAGMDAPYRCNWPGGSFS